MALKLLGSRKHFCGKVEKGQSNTLSRPHSSLVGATLFGNNPSLGSCLLPACFLGSLSEELLVTLIHHTLSSIAECETR
jgi:hypothetical protein